MTVRLEILVSSSLIRKILLTQDFPYVYTQEFEISLMVVVSTLIP